MFAKTYNGGANVAYAYDNDSTVQGMGSGVMGTGYSYDNIKNKGHPIGCPLFLMTNTIDVPHRNTEAGLDLYFRPGMGENNCVAAIQLAASKYPPDICI